MADLRSLDDDAIIKLLKSNAIKHYMLEKELEASRAVIIRQQFLLSGYPDETRANIPCESYLDYEIATKSCCESIIGYVPIPLGLAGPLLVGEREFNVPIATTEGALIASLSRGCRAVYQRC